MDAPDEQPESSSTLSPELGDMEVSGVASTSSSVSQVRHEEEEEDSAEVEAVRDETFSCGVSETTCSCICLLSTVWFLGCFLTLHMNFKDTYM